MSTSASNGSPFHFLLLLGATYSLTNCCPSPSPSQPPPKPSPPPPMSCVRRRPRRPRRQHHRRRRHRPHHRHHQHHQHHPHHNLSNTSTAAAAAIANTTASITITIVTVAVFILISVSYHDLRHRLLLLLFLLLLPRPPRPPPHRRSITIIASFVILQRIFKNLMILTRATATSCVFFVLWSPRSLGASVGPREGQGSICQPLCSESAGSVLSCRALKAPRKVRSGLHNPELT